MKKLFILSMLLALTLMSFGQATPGKVVRIANRTTAFGVNLPQGTLIYCVSDSTNWEVKTAVASTATLTTGNASLVLKKTDVRNSATRGAVNYSLAIDSTKATYQNLNIAAATTSYAGAMTAADKTKLDALVTTSGTAVAQIYEIAADTLASCKVFLPYLAVDSTKFVVSVNGVELSHASATGQYWVAPLASRYVRFKMPIYKYDVVSVQYFK